MVRWLNWAVLCTGLCLWGLSLGWGCWYAQDHFKLGLARSRIHLNIIEGSEQDCRELRNRYSRQPRGISLQKDFYPQLWTSFSGATSELGLRFPQQLQAKMNNLSQRVTVIPFWIVLLPIVCLVVLTERRARLKRRRVGHCAQCGYDLTGNVSGRCSECGEAIPVGSRPVDFSAT